MVRKRSYKQYCSLALALDRVGDRWTLLIFRQLLTGPKRFKDLLEDLPGIGTNLLAARLRQLERDRFIRRRTLPSPAGSTVYELTDTGRTLEPSLVALGQWGLQFMVLPKKGQAYRPSYAIAGMKITFRPEVARGLRETHEYEIDGQIFHVRVEGGACQTRQGPGRDPAFRLTTDTQTLQRLATRQLDIEEALSSGAARLRGNAKALARAARIFGLPKQAA